MKKSKDIIEFYMFAYEQLFGTQPIEDFPALQPKVRELLKSGKISGERLIDIIHFYLSIFDTQGYSKSLADLLDIEGKKAFIWTTCSQMAPYLNRQKPQATGTSNLYWDNQDDAFHAGICASLKWLLENRGKEIFLKMIDQHPEAKKMTTQKWTNKDVDTVRDILISEYGFTWNIKIVDVNHLIPPQKIFGTVGK